MRSVALAIIDLMLAAISLGGCLFVRAKLRELGPYNSRAWVRVGYVLFSLFVLCGLAAVASAVATIVIGAW